LGILFKEGSRLPEHCACSRDRSDGYQGIENVPGRIVVADRNWAYLLKRGAGYQNTVHAVETGVMATRALIMYRRE